MHRFNLARVWGAYDTLRDRRLALLLGALLALLALAAQVPRDYHIAVGRADGSGSDLPLLSGYYGPERDPRGSFRWSSERSSVELPGTGQRLLAVTLRVLPVGDDIVARAPQVLELWSNGRQIGTLPVDRRGAAYHFLVPAPPSWSGDQQIELRSATFEAGDPPRALGVPVDDVRVTGGGLALPAWRSTLTWLLSALVLWLAVRRAGFSSQTTLALLAPLALLLAVAAALDPPRTAIGALVAVRALVLGFVLVAVLRAVVPRLAVRFAVPLDARALRWLLLLALIAWGMRYGGKTYPFSMEGDIGFHTNRFTDVVEGRVLLLSKNRGVEFPYPPALYLLLAPWMLAGFTRPGLLHASGALLDAVSPLLVYAISTSGCTMYDVRCTIGMPVDRKSQIVHRTLLWSVLAAALYSLSASGFMTTWWNFSTHIFTQWAHLLLVTAVVLWWTAHEQTEQNRRTAEPQNQSLTPSPLHTFTPSRSVAVLFVLQMLVYAGHFGFWINTTLLGGIGLVALLVWRKRDARAQVCVASFIAAQLAAAALFYSGYTELFIAQVQATASGGLTGLAGREAAPLGVLWTTLWNAGLHIHFGFFPVPLALAGLLFLGVRGQGSGVRDRGTGATDGQQVLRFSSFPVLAVLVGGTFLIALVFAALPFLSGSTLSTRWLMFSAWAIAVASALAMQALWHCGRAGRVIVAAVCGYVVWIMASQWLVALIWRVRPPEPF